LPNIEEPELNARRSPAAVTLLTSLLVALTGCLARQPAPATFPTGLLPSSVGTPEVSAAITPDAPATTSPDTPAASSEKPRVIRGQSGSSYSWAGSGTQTSDATNSAQQLQNETPGSHQHTRQGMQASQAQYQPPATWPQSPPTPPSTGLPPPPSDAPANPSGAPIGSGTAPATAPAPGSPQPLTGPPGFMSPMPGMPGNAQPYVNIDPTMTTPVDVFVSETQTGRFMFGAGINSDAGVTGQIVIDERNFDITRVPTAWRDFVDGTAFRGAGQGFRIEAMPGSEVQRYLASFTEPYLFNTPVSLNLSGFLFDRRYFDWDEQRLGGRLALGYRLTHDLSISGAIRGEEVQISRPRIAVPELDEVLGKNELYSGRVTLTHDTRDIPFFPSEGHLIEMSFEQAFGTFDYPRAELDYRKYFMVRERPDGSGRHTLGYTFQLGFSGTNTPLYENYFAGGYSTLRGFQFRGASPVSTGTDVRVGGTFRFLGSAEYVFPLTADDMLKGAFFVDYGTVEEEITMKAENFRVAPGFGLRVSVPALGPAPLAFDFAFPIAKADTDETRTFSFFFGVGR
jgi:outer membrane protein insertion porin family